MNLYRAFELLDRLGFKTLSQLDQPNPRKLEAAAAAVKGSAAPSCQLQAFLSPNRAAYVDTDGKLQV